MSSEFQSIIYAYKVNGGPFSYDGHVVDIAFRFPVNESTRALIRCIKVIKAPKQLLHISCENCQAEIFEKRMDHGYLDPFDIQTTTEIRFTNVKDGAKASIWNASMHEGRTYPESSMGNYGVVVLNETIQDSHRIVRLGFNHHTPDFRPPTFKSIEIELDIFSTNPS